MDKVLKRRLIGASILIALAVIFLPMLLVDPDSVTEGSGGRVEVPPMPETARDVRRIPLNPETARAPEPDARPARAEPPPEEPARTPPADEIVLRPELAEPPATDPAAPDDEAVSDAEAESAQPEREVATEAEPASDEESPAEAPSQSVADSEPAPSATEPTPDPEISMGDYVVQVASFGSEDSANQVRARLEALGHIVSRDEIVRGQSLLYRLRTGPYPSREAAQTALEQITATVQGVEPIVRELDEELRAEGESGFAVQVGSFVSADNAETETQRLAGLGFEAFRFSETVGERSIWRVVVGPVPAREDADSLKARLADEAGVEGLVVSYP